MEIGDKSFSFYNVALENTRNDPPMASKAQLKALQPIMKE